MYSSSKIYISFQQTLLGKLNMHVQLNGTGPFLTPHTESHSKWTENLKLKNTESVTFLEGNMEEGFMILGSQQTGLHQMMKLLHSRGNNQ